MANIDPALLARAKAQIEAHPLFRQLTAGHGRAQAGGAIDPRMFGVDYLPPGYVYSIGAGRVVNQHDKWDVIMPAVGAGLLGAGVLGAAGVGPLAGESAAAAPGAVSGAEAGEIAFTSAPYTAPSITTATSAAAPTSAAELMARDAARHGAGNSLIPHSVGDYAKLGTLAIPAVNAFRNGNGSSLDEDELADEVKRSLALQRQRLEQTQPVFDNLVRMAYGNSPMQYRGAPPPGMPASTPPKGAYQYTPPRFG